MESLFLSPAIRGKMPGEDLPRKYMLVVITTKILLQAAGYFRSRYLLGEEFEISFTLSGFTLAGYDTSSPPSDSRRGIFRNW